MQKTKLGGRFWLALTVFSLVGQVAWVVENMYFNVFIYKMFHATAAQISLMVAASAVVATLTTILIGALSDRVGRRKIFICVGYLLWGISILSFALIRVDVISPMVSAGVAVTTVCVNLTILMDCVMTFFGSTANDACFNAWLTDSTDDTNRGAAEGINAMMPMMAILVVFGGFMFFDLEKAASWVTIFTIIGVVVILIGIVGFWLIREPKVTPSPAGSYWGSILYGFRPSVIRRHKVLYLTLLAFAGFGISIQVFMPYLILYYEKSLGMTNYVLVMAPAIVLAAVFTAFYGRRYDTNGFRRSILPGIALLMAGYLALYFTRDTLPVFFGSLCMMMGYLSSNAIFGAMMRTYTPPEQVGLFQGLRIVAQVLVPGVIGPAIGAAVLKNAELVVNGDGTTSFLPNANIWLAAFAAGVVLCGLLALLFVPDKEVALIFVFLLGYYPLAKPKFERIRPAVLRIVCKLLLCNGAVLAMYGLVFLLVPAGSISQELRTTALAVSLATLAMGNVAFVLYDRALHNMLMMYRLAWRPKLHKTLGWR